MSDRTFYIPQTEAEKPIVQIIGDKKFTGFFLGQFLQRQNCQVLFEPSPTQKIDYIFFLSQNDNEDLKDIFELAQKNKAKLLLAFPTRLSQNSDYVFRLGYSLKVNFRIVFLGKVFGPRMEPADFRQLISAGVYEKNDYVFVSDIVYGLSKAIFTHGTNEKIFYLLSEKKQEVLSREEERLIGWQPIVSFEEGLEKTKSFFCSTESEPPKQELETKPPEKLIKSFLPPSTEPLETDNQIDQEKPTLLDRFKKPSTEVQVEKKKSFLSKIPPLILLFLFFILLSLPLTSIGGSVVLGKFFLDRCQEDLTAGKFLSAHENANLAKKSFVYGKQSFNLFLPLINLLPAENLIIRGEKLIDLGITASQGLSSGSLLGDRSWQVFANFFLAQKTLTGQEISQLIDENHFLVTDTDRQLSWLQTLTSKTRFEKQLFFLPLVTQALEKGEFFWPVLPELLALNGKKTYLILLQNNAELRPTGGFIGSFALATLSQGELIDFEVQDVYWADGQLKGHVEPPSELKDYLGEGGWYLRDSNWDPDFPTSAARAVWFLEKETGRHVDGVIALNLNVVEDILQQIGEVVLPDFNETINAQNLFEKAEYHSEVNFFPGSTQKQDFLGGLVFTLFEEFKKADPQLLAKTGLSLFESIKSKDLLFYFSDQELEEKFLSLNWGGQIRKPLCPATGESTSGNQKAKCITDFLMVVDANVGVNKANYFVKRSLYHQVVVDRKNQLEITTRLVYQNDSPSEKFPAGTYRNYLRLLLPLQVEIEQVRIKNNQDRLLEKLSKEELNLLVNHDLLSVGFLVEIPYSDSRIVEIDYRLPLTLSYDVNHYFLLVQKQPGQQDQQFQFSFVSNPSLKIIETEPLLTASRGSQVNFNPVFDQDLYFSILLEK